MRELQPMHKKCTQIICNKNLQAITITADIQGKTRAADDLNVIGR